MTTAATYAFAPRVLRRWRDERLSLAAAADGRVTARFRFDGSTCGNVPFELVYDVELASPEDGYRVLAMRCAPTPGDEGHRQMCSYRESADRILQTLATEQPFVGRPLAEVLAWSPALLPAGCVCAAASRAHKWLAVLQTLHFALLGERT